MVILEKVDLKKLDLNSFRSFKCLCELCDCGCFERSRQPHHAQCKRNGAQRTSVNAGGGSAKDCFLSHYKETYDKKSYEGGRPAKLHVPPPDENNVFPVRASFDYNTVTRASFQPIEIKEITKSAKIMDTYEKSNEPFEKLSAYRAEFVPFQNVEPMAKMKPAPSRIKIPNEKFATNTTSNDHFKNWNAGPPPVSYADKPSYVGDVLFPSKDRDLTTVFNATYQPLPYSKRDGFNRSENKGTLKPEGDMDMNTNYKVDFVPFKNPERAKKFAPDYHSQQVVNTERVPIASVTQTRVDFKPYPGYKQREPNGVDPYASNLNHDLYPGNTYDHETVYKKEYTGIDVVKNPKAKSYKSSQSYEKPTESFETETVSMKDFKPINVSLIPTLKAKKIESKIRLANGGPMETKTTSMVHYPAYEVKPVVMGRDPMPQYYIPPKEKFIGESVNNSTYRGEKGPKAVSFKSLEGNIKIDKSQAHDMLTNYRDAFTEHGMSICEAKAYLIVKAMEDKKGVRGSTANSTSSYLNQNSGQKIGTVW